MPAGGQIFGTFHEPDSSKSVDGTVMSEVFQYIPWQFFVLIALLAIVVTAIACSPTALVNWVFEYFDERKRRARIAEIERAEKQLPR